MRAPYCKDFMEEIAECEHIEKEIKKKAVERAKFEGIEKDKRLKDPADRYFGKLEQYAMDKMSYY